MAWRGLLFSFLLLGSLCPVWGHPHVWADIRAEVTITSGYIEGVWANWTFDEVFSQLILSDHDNGDGILSSAENAAVKKGYFDNLKSYQYFTHLGVGNRTLAVPVPQNFQARVTTEGRIIFRFFLPLGLRIDAKTPLAVAFYDDSFFTDMVFEKANPVVLSVSGGKASAILRKDPAKAFYGGQVVPIYAMITWGPS